MTTAEQLLTELSAAQGALRGGRPAEARHLALAVLQAATASGALPQQAAALMCLAECESTAGKMRDAADWAQRAVHAFRMHHDVCGEADALTLQAHSATMLGRNEEAVEAALLAVRLLDDAAPGSRQRVRAYNYLGLAYGWSRSFARAHETLEQAARIAEEIGEPGAAFQPRINHFYATVIQACTERALGGQIQSLAALAARREACRLAKEQADSGVMTPGTYIIGRTLWGLMSCIQSAWSGDFAGAESALAEGHGWATRYGMTARMNATEAWAQTELAWARGEIDQALHHAAQMLAIAAPIEHQQLACTAHHLMAQLHELKGQPVKALDEMRRLREREQNIRADSLESRARVVTWQLEIRRSENVVQQLQSASREYERLSLEDPLTGIANRRCFERVLARHLAEAPANPAPLWIAFLDVDDFKQVNDRHSHAVGDRVLVRIAQILRACVREKDLPARLAGDEFVVLLHGVQPQAARAARERIAQAIAGEAWGDIAPGLQVRASVGLACTRPDDTVASVLHRSDTEMYALKRARPGGP